MSLSSNGDGARQSEKVSCVFVLLCSICLIESVSSSLSSLSDGSALALCFRNLTFCATWLGDLVMELDFALIRSRLVALLALLLLVPSLDRALAGTGELGRDLSGMLMDLSVSILD